MFAPDRRHFLCGLSALCVSGQAKGAQATSVKHPYDQIGVQLYTVRADFNADPLGTLRKIKALGYESVESISFGGMTPEAFKNQLSDVGLQMPSGHIGLSDWIARPEAVLDDMAAAGAVYALLAWLPEDARKDWKALAAKMNRWGELAKARDLGFAYHNHNFEFTASAEGMPYHLLLENTDPNLVAFELDCYWASLAGHNPVHVLKEHGNRIRLLHLKDKLANGDMAPVGEGVIDFPAVLTQAKIAGVEYVYVEHDNPTDPWASLTTSLHNLKA